MRSLFRVGSFHPLQCYQGFPVYNCPWASPQKELPTLEGSLSETWLLQDLRGSSTDSWNQPWGEFPMGFSERVTFLQWHLMLPSAYRDEIHTWKICFACGSLRGCWSSPMFLGRCKSRWNPSEVNVSLHEWKPNKDFRIWPSSRQLNLAQQILTTVYGNQICVILEHFNSS